ncbi:hypothetical protein ACFXPV_30750 [Streptomyces sp. NPDC059118]|uniref:hypothetical protein n=1 Tax=unclassified Streptomyces TaxID=2593676 RepID=UPI00368B7304
MTRDKKRKAAVRKTQKITGDRYARAARTHARGEVVDLSRLNLLVCGRPVASASTELFRGHDGRLEDVKETFEACFSPSSHWCEVNGDLHTISGGDAEIRLSLQLHGTAWYADYFDAAWGSHQYRTVPVESRADVAMYVDRTKELRWGLLCESDLRKEAAEGGGAAVDCLVRYLVGLQDEWFAALDGLHDALLDPAGTLPAWAEQFLQEEAEDLSTAREWLTSAVLAYHHGTAGRRPDTLYRRIGLSSLVEMFA